MKFSFKRTVSAAFVACGLFSISSAGSAQTDGIDEPLVGALDESVAETNTPDLYARDTYELTSMLCPFKGTIDYDPEHVDCFRLAVPENRESEASRTIQLSLIKLNAREPEDWNAKEDGEWTRRDDPVIYLTGGPGAVATGYVGRLKDHGIRNHRDLYILEQRGIGFSDDFCPEFSNVDPASQNVTTYDESARASLMLLETCFKRAQDAGVDLSGYSTIENARDVKALRIALGYDQWNVWGISYGSVLGQAYLHEDPEGIRAAVIDAIVPIDPEINFQGIARYYQRVLTILSELCAEDVDCTKNFPDFEERLKTAIQTVYDEPIVISNVLDEEAFPNGEAVAFHDIIAGLPFIQFYEQSNYPTLPALIDAIATMVEERDYDRLRLLTSGDGNGGFVGISEGMYNAIACNDGWVTSYRQSYERDAADHPILSLINGPLWAADEMVVLCEKYGMSPRDPADYAPRQIDTRTIVAEGAMDPITPPPFAEAIMPNFTNGTYVEWAYAGHGPTRSVDCAGEFLTAFYDDPTGELDTSCADDMEKPTFSGPLYQDDTIPVVIAQLEEDPKTLALPAILLIIAALVLPLGALIYTFAPIARIINRQKGDSTGGARLVAWLTTLLGTGAMAGLGLAIFSTTQASDFLILVGLVGCAKYAVMTGHAAGLFGLVTLILAIRARMSNYLPIGALLGLLFTGVAGIALATGLWTLGFGIG